MNTKNRITRLILVMTLGLFLTFGTMSCTVLESMFQDKVATTQDNVKEEAVETAIPLPTNVLIPDKERARLEATGKTLVLVDKGAVKDPEQAVEVMKPGIEGVIGVGLGIANTLWPGVAALEGLGLLFSQRKRQHYAEAVKAITPYDGNVSVKEAVVSIARATGLAHSSSSSKEAFVAEKLKAS